MKSAISKLIVAAAMLGVFGWTGASNARVLASAAFADVTSVVPDDARGLIYLSNGEGLWVVQAKRPRKTETDDKYLNADVGP